MLEKQEWIPVDVLAKMWSIDFMSAEHLVLLLSSMSLAKTSAHESGEGASETCLSVHDLHHDFCGEQTKKNSDAKLWHFRLLRGHMPSLTYLKKKLQSWI